jgi:hypothetical protein
MITGPLSQFLLLDMSDGERKGSLVFFVSLTSGNLGC